MGESLDGFQIRWIFCGELCRALRYMQLKMDDENHDHDKISLPDGSRYVKIYLEK